MKKNGSDCSEKVADLCEEHVQMTPPSAVICDNLVVNGHARKTQEALLLVMIHPKI